MSVELGWRKCIKCGELFWDGIAGACSGGNSHDSGDSTNPRFIGLIAPIEQGTNLSSVSTMPGWRKCQFCQCLFFETTGQAVFHPGPALKACPAIGGAGKHSAAGSSDYLVTTGFAPFDAAAPFMNNGWERCGKCNTLFQTSSGNSGGHCISDGTPHTGIRTPLFACRERLARLPLPSKAGPGMDVNFKVDTQSALGWMVVSSCTWTAASENRLSAQSKWGEDVFTSLDFEMVDGPQCAVNINVGGTKHYEILGIDIKDITVQQTSIQQSMPCVDFDGTQDPDVEFSPGVNNGLILSIFPLGKMFPKNNNRVRLHLNASIGGFQDFELETQ